MWTLTASTAAFLPCWVQGQAAQVPPPRLLQCVRSYRGDLQLVDAMAPLPVAAEGVHNAPSPWDPVLLELLKHVSSLFTFEAIRSCGMGNLAELRQEGQ